MERPNAQDKLVSAGIERNPEVVRLLQEGKREEREQHGDEMRVNIRWGRDQVNIIKKAAAGLDVPYQLYIKQVVIRQAMIDLKETEQALLAAKS
jgi:hypothetical protein